METSSEALIQRFGDRVKVAPPCRRPVDAIDRQAIADWVDDRIVDFVRTYLSLHENEYYVQDDMVEDPIAEERFPRFVAAANIEWKGKTYYFIGDETRREFEAKQGLGMKPRSA